MSKLGPSGDLLSDAHLPGGVNTYRAYLLPFDGARDPGGEHVAGGRAGDTHMGRRFGAGPAGKS